MENTCHVLVSIRPDKHGATRPTENVMSKKEEVQVDEKLVKEIASLARLDLTNEETKTFVSQFKDILEYVSILNEVDTDDVPPAYLSSANQSVTREDEVQEKQTSPSLHWLDPN